MYRYVNALLVLSALALAAPLEERASAPSAAIQHGTVIGSTLLGVDSFKGIPFATPPIGDLRLKPPQPLTSSFGTLTATGTPKSCPQLFFQVETSDIPSDVIGTLLNDPFVQVATDTSEDCLTINIQRPAGTTATSKLPVVFWIFGGGM